MEVEFEERRWRWKRVGSEFAVMGHEASGRRGRRFASGAVGVGIAEEEGVSWASGGFRWKEVRVS